MYSTMSFILLGTNTSLPFLYALLAILTAKPAIQTRMQEELDNVLGGRHPTIKDKESMPYTQAVFEEVLRYVVPVTAVPHKATKDSSICGHFIPKGTMVTTL